MLTALSPSTGALANTTKLAATTTPNTIGTTARPLSEQAAQWLSRQVGVPAARIRVQAPDPRVRQVNCPSGLQFDSPFSSLNTVRVRCAEPAWQLYLSAQWDPDEATSATPVANGGSGPAGAGQASPAAGAAPRPAAAPTTPPKAAPPAPEPRRALALTRAVSRGAFLSPASVDWVLVPAREADATLITDPQALEQVEALRDLPAGQVLRQTDLRAAVLVRSGQSVTMTVGQGSGFTITVRLEALQDGRMGDRVMLRNTESGRTVSGVVTGLNTARGA